MEEAGMKAAPFEYARARDIPHALKLWSSAGPEARLLAGGQSLLAMMALRLTDVPALIDINGLEALQGVRLDGDMLRIGALTRHRELIENPLIAHHAPVLARAAAHVGHPAIRTRGSLGGSIAHGDPAAELPACALALDARILVRGPDGERSIKAADFHLGFFETALEPFELVVAVEFPVLGPRRRQHVVEIARRSGDYAMAGLVIAADADGARLSDIRLAFFAVADKPKLAPLAAAALEGGDLDEACRVLEEDIEASGDLQSSATMKLHLSRVLLRRVAVAMQSSPS
jgi:aerobic carbon-monoxide dehydrogenase medium subunit